MRRRGVHECLFGDTSLAGDVVVADGRMTQVGALPAGPRGTPVAGFVEAQIHGIAGVDFSLADLEGYRTAGAAPAAADPASV